MATISGGGGAFQTRVTALTDAQVKALPTTPVVIVPATQSLNYSGTPATLPIPVSASLVVARAAADYTNLDASCKARLGWGSDYSVDAVGLERPIGTEADARGIFTGGTLPLPVPAGLGVWGAPNVFTPQGLNGVFFDNALALTVLNGAAGNFTGGDAANSAHVSVVYYVLKLS